MTTERSTEIVTAAIKIIMKYGCSTFDDCGVCPLNRFKDRPGVFGDLCNSISRVK